MHSATSSAKKGAARFVPGEDARFMATCPKGLENLLAKELAALGVEQVQESIAACYFSAPLELAYFVCLWSRVANRIVLLLLRDRAESTGHLHGMAAGLDWSSYFAPGNTIAIDFNGTNAFIRDTRFGSQLVKDAINEHFQAQGESRLSVELEAPDVSIYVRLFKARISIGIDLVGESLHRRGYRQAGASAPLKENLAAALLLLSGWPALAADGAALVDPMCGSATLLIEGALIAAGIAPSYLREHWPLQQLRMFDSKTWQPLYDEARGSIERVEKITSPIIGYDNDPRAVSIAQQNIRAAGLENKVSVQGGGVAGIKLTLSPTPGSAQCPGLLITNPPYGVRLGEAGQLGQLYSALGEMLKRECDGWQAAIFTGNTELGWSTGLRSWRQHKLFNGSIACQLQRYRIEPESYRRAPTVLQGVIDEESLSEGAAMLANRLRKNLRRLKSWLAANPDICYRVYDAELPEYAVAIDCYPAVKAGAWGKGDGEVELYFHVQEYQAPASVDSKVAARRLNDAMLAVSCVFAVDVARIAQKSRERQKGKQQYQKLDQRAPDLLVRESGLRFKVNLGRYLDTGLFLDHRPVRALVGESARGGRFLNLFAYTSAATVYAASGGARSSTSVDMSNTYIEWSRANFKLNGISTTQHQLVQADCLAWLQTCEQYFDCILLDPPSFSNSARMSVTLDIQRDHLQLIDACVQRLAEGGCLYFSNNKRGFKLSGEVQAKYQVEDLTQATQDPDFNRPRPAHYCWRITRKDK